MGNGCLRWQEKIGRRGMFNTLGKELSLYINSIQSDKLSLIELDYFIRACMGTDFLLVFFV